MCYNTPIAQYNKVTQTSYRRVQGADNMGVRSLVSGGGLPRRGRPPASDRQPVEKQVLGVGVERRPAPLPHLHSGAVGGASKALA